ncbi:MAG: response regulator transcription factor [Spirochaetaceae bacterium]|nr:response regulator transcription factor [Spirochaetaceae bacterium]MCF7947437.1 response regulator transcription factor [Spirochaetia bacterium]MCF7952408.1 response regulator transcription factor [Spirochaetaceae bacterium]
MIHVIVVDDHHLIRRGLKQYIERIGDIEVVAEAATGEELLHFSALKSCDVILLDIGLPDKNGIELLKEIKNYYPDMHILVLSMHPEERYALRALENGACGYITKGSSPEELERAIRKVATGGTYISEALAEKFASGVIEKQTAQPHSMLSDREFLILTRLGNGEAVKSIAWSLNISVSTVHTYKQRIMEKLKLKHNADLIHYVDTHNLDES